MISEIEIFQQTAQMLDQLGFTIAKQDLARPWGGFYVIKESQAQKFADHFFPEELISPDQKISPKILMVAPHKRLSWQYHYRRAEIWKCLGENICAYIKRIGRRVVIIDYHSNCCIFFCNSSINFFSSTTTK